ncbi:hypothetical protein IW150_000285 [Coemansia sp. RSA 2607]|nr:hypothetical protein IW150_000285 [Coemansia sp. RSA 2607]
MLFSDTRFAVKTSAKNACNFLKRATTGVFRRAQQKRGDEDNAPLPTLSVNPKYKKLYHIPDMFADADTYTSGTDLGMLRLFGSQSSIRSQICEYLLDIMEEYGYRAECLAMAMQILDRFLTNTTATRVKERIYHYALISLMIAVEEVHAYTMSTKQFERHVGKHCSNKTIKKYKKQVLETLAGVVSVPTTADLLLVTLQIAAYKYPSVFAANGNIENVEEFRRKRLFMDVRPLLFNCNLLSTASRLVLLTTFNQQCLRYAGSMLASACFYFLAEKMAGFNMDKASLCARHSYKDVAGIVDYLKLIV